MVGSRLRLSVTLEGIIPIKIPCLDIGGTNLGSWCRHDLSLSPYLFSEYDVDELLGMVAVTGICEDYIPEGQACNLPLGPGSSHDLFCHSIFLSLQFWQKFHLDEKEFTGVENLWSSPSAMFRISSLLSSRFLFLAPFLSLGQSF